ncbi:hypothetical protein VNO78_23420 [Psophocarpus tetragonolobus]|uniref:RING-type domain-containing protein n=1 Tax=Psophocarpus tetragonolobus TaxID=3891 RepID=A0AAN9S3I1_PSOTE
MELLSNEFSHPDDRGVLHLPPALDITDRSAKILNTNLTMADHHHQNHGRSIFLKRSRHYYGHQYSRRNSINHANGSSSRGKEYREKVFSRPERIQSSPIGMDAIPPNNEEMICGICEKLLNQKINFLGSSMSCCELSVVAVLICGHVYHANCLEHKTRFEELRDPPCPVCASLLLQDRDKTVT